ncbi:MAG: single-stranded-DNA-specific exonuclease RecJ, partial [Acutalibacteraceae bacterium]
MILISRGFSEIEDIEEFFRGDGQLSDPFEMIDMDKAVGRITAALKKGEKIAVFGDYDADGVSSCALMYSYLSKKTSNLIMMIPDRLNDGYGMNKSSVDILKSRGVNLIITVDNGISCIEEIDYANSIGIDVVVTDHHLPGEKLPDAVAVVDPQRKDCPSYFKGYAGVGVAFKLICALEGCACEDMFYEYAAFVAIGTIADVVPLLGENRTIVKAGIKEINNRNNPNCTGIHALMEIANAKDKELTSGQISFMLTPRINAVGRMESPMPAYELLLEKNYDKALKIAEYINSQNIKRQETEKQVVASADEIIIKQGKMNNRVIVVCGDNWHHGVLGIVASKLLDKYSRPVVVLSADKDEVNGSARSFGDFHMHDALKYCASLLDNFGGHKQAAGLSLKKENIEEFEKKINEYALLSNAETVPELTVDCPLKTTGINISTAYAVSRLAPFGADNPLPVFGLFGVRIENITPIGNDAKNNGKHIKLSVSKNGVCVNAVKFFTRTDEFPFEIGETVDLAVTLEMNKFMGKDCTSVIVKDIRLSESVNDLINEISEYENFLRGEINDSEKAAAMIPHRDEAGAVYSFLKALAKRGRYITDFEHIYESLKETLNFSKIKISLDILNEIGIIIVNYHSDYIGFTLTDNRRSFDSSGILKKFKEKAKIT